ncbi:MULTISPECIES: hypothetical protein [unclassified Natrinema]|uniref:hypothetical protein n=1 Tax=unclassified Natrinema TaxID=2622230 RepID=UPI00026D5134|nr:MULTISPECIES: hypothetical protein [unclassified Natrinema]AFO58819.1 hypothetical protein NJ7G_3603 [Natrinema sp. J7-2]
MTDRRYLAVVGFEERRRWWAHDPSSAALLRETRCCPVRGITSHGVAQAITTGRTASTDAAAAVLA